MCELFLIVCSSVARNNCQHQDAQLLQSGAELSNRMKDKEL